MQIARARLQQWSPQVEDRFLQVLAATCNVKAAYSAVGMSKGSTYAHRKRWPAFARRWAEAVEIGYDRIEAGLIEAADNLFSNPEQPPEIAITGMTVAHAIHILHMHKNEVRGIGRRPGIGARPPRTLDAKMRAEIMRIFERVARATDAEPSEEQRESDRREWALRRSSGQAGRARPGFGRASA